MEISVSESNCPNFKTILSKYNSFAMVAIMEISKCICPNFKMYFFKFQNIFIFSFWQCRCRWPMAVFLCHGNKWEWSLLVYLSSVLLPLIHFVQQVAFVEILTFFIWRRNILNSYSTLSQFTFYREFHLRCICHFWRDSAKFVHPGKETFISLAHSFESKALSFCFVCCLTFDRLLDQS